MNVCDVICIRRARLWFIYSSVSSSTTVLLGVSSHCLSKMVLELCIWPYGVNFGQFYLKWHDCWPGHCIMDELQPLISPTSSSFCLSFSSISSLCVLLSALYNWREWREQKEDGNVTVSEWERARTFKRERERERGTLCQSLWQAHTQAHKRC